MTQLRRRLLRDVWTTRLVGRAETDKVNLPVCVGEAA